MKNKVAVIIQCRLSSTRFPQKALKDLGGKPVLAWVLNSMKKVTADRYFVATDEASFNELKPVCEENGFEIFAGSLENVLERYCSLIEKIDADIVVRATADNPFLFYEAAQGSLDEFIEKNKDKNVCDYLTWSGLPHGAGVEVFSAKSLLQAASLTDLPYDKEHVGPALYNHKENFNCEFVKAPERFNFPHLRCTIDTYSDYLRAELVVQYFSSKKNMDFSEPFTTEEILEALNSNYVKNPVVLCPSVVKGFGTGHLHRCLQVACETNSFVYIPKKSTLSEIKETINLYKEKGLKDFQLLKELPDETYKPVIISDEFKLTSEKIDLYKNAGSLIAIDEGSEFSDKCDYLLDIIPSYDIQRKANYVEPGFITKPENVKTEKKNSKNFSKILVCVGGEDPAGLTVPVAEEFSKCLPDSEITAVLSSKLFEQHQNNQSDSTNKQIKQKINYVKTIPELREKIFQYDLVITHYGLTAFEAVYAGCAVILLPTTNLHQNLARKYGFAYLQKINTNEVQKVLNSENLYAKLNFGESKSLGDFLKDVSAGEKLKCPVCQNNDENNQIVSRNLTRTYRRCSNCSMIYISWTMDENKSYSKSYFFEDYKKQYGKTYQEDFESIKAQGLRRVNVINSITKIKDKNVLDIGCAYGPFLSAARDYGMNPFGTDISQDAVDYVVKDLKFPASVAVFPEINTDSEFGIKCFDVVTMWFVIEHFKNLKTVLEKVSDIVKKGGIFAFSTPSGLGISAKSNKDNFYQNSPTDHYSVWEYTNANKILNQFGFEVVKIVSTGHHPERFPSIKKNNVQKDSLKWKITDKYSHMKKLGDTVEIYCRKK